MHLMRDLGCIQIDPISAVARSHLLVLWSRLGNYDMAQFDRLLWQERKLFEYWAHCASIVLTEDYPIHSLLMRNYASGDSKWAQRVREWEKQNGQLSRYILKQLRRAGPLPARMLEEDGIHPRAWVSTGWTSGRNVSRMLDFLWLQGKIMVAGRAGLQKLWDLSERVLPEWTPRERLSAHEATCRAAQKSLRALGVATPKQIERHFTRGRYPDLPRVLDELQAQERIARVQVEGLAGTWYIHADNLPRLEEIENQWEPRTVLLAPFDNLICDRARTRQLFDFDYSIEIYTPTHKRKYGYYVLPILHGDRLIGRIDPLMKRAEGRLEINAMYWEPNVRVTRPLVRAVKQTIQDLGQFLGAREIAYGKRVLKEWR